jgi:hypothetical protein
MVIRKERERERERENKLYPSKPCPVTHFLQLEPPPKVSTNSQ